MCMVVLRGARNYNDKTQKKRQLRVRVHGAWRMPSEAADAGYECMVREGRLPIRVEAGQRDMRTTK